MADISEQVTPPLNHTGGLFATSPPPPPLSPSFLKLLPLTKKRCSSENLSPIHTPFSFPLARTCSVPIILLIIHLFSVKSQKLFPTSSSPAYIEICLQRPPPPLLPTWPLCPWSRRRRRPPLRPQPPPPAGDSPRPTPTVEERTCRRFWTRAKGRRRRRRRTRITTRGEGEQSNMSSQKA